MWPVCWWLLVRPGGWSVRSAVLLYKQSSLMGCVSSTIYLQHMRQIIDLCPRILRSYGVIFLDNVYPAFLYRCTTICAGMVHVCVLSLERVRSVALHKQQCCLRRRIFRLCEAYKQLVIPLNGFPPACAHSPSVFLH